MKRFFLQDSPYTRQARFLSFVWTLLIFIGCFTPGHELPEVDVPFIDKWTHFVAFGVLTFLWLGARPAYTGKTLLYFFFMALLLGCLIEAGQGYFTSLGRSMELMDVVADAVGAALGIGAFIAGARVARK